MRLETSVVAVVVLWILGNQALHHITGGENDACGECFEWDLLWVGPDDAVIIETTVLAM